MLPTTRHTLSQLFLTFRRIPITEKKKFISTRPLNFTKQASYCHPNSPNPRFNNLFLAHYHTRQIKQTTYLHHRDLFAWKKDNFSSKTCIEADQSRKGNVIKSL